MIIGMDLSKRSSALVAISSDGALVEFTLIRPFSDMSDEDILNYVEDMTLFFVSECLAQGSVAGIGVEGLSFNSVGSGKDFLAGIWWTVKRALYNNYEIPVGVIPNQSWFSYVISKEEKRALLLSTEKDKRKKAVVNKLPFEVKVRFEKYILDNGCKKEGIYDLADAFWIAQYRRSLES